MRTGIFGGTFDPVHLGHVRLAHAFCEACALERLLVIPTRVPPHKERPVLTDGAHRLAMCRLAFADMPQAQVDDMELTRSDTRPSYTAETMKALRAARPDEAFWFLMGGDMFLTVTQWYEWQTIAELATLCAAARSADEYEQLKAHSKLLGAQGARCVLLPLEPLPMSSTQVREAVRTGDRQTIAECVPPAVATYIEQHGLYK